MISQYHVVQDFDLCCQVLEYLKTVPVFAFDIEATGLKPIDCQFLGIGFSWMVKTGIYIPWRVRDTGIFVSDFEYQWSLQQREELSKLLREIFFNPKSLKAAHNIGFDIWWLETEFGIPIKDIENIYCTQFAEHLKDPYTGPDAGVRLKLETLVNARFSDLQGYKDLWAPLKKQHKTDLSEFYSTQIIGEYCAKDCDACLRLLFAQRANMSERPYQDLFYTRLMPAVKLVSRMKARGFLVDMDYLTETKKDLYRQKAEVTEKIQDFVGDLNFNPDSEKDLQALFFRKLNLQPLNDLHLDEPVLRNYYEKYGVMIANDILEYRKLSKLIGTYFENIERLVDKKTHRVHANFKLWGTRTGRLSCENPNLQNQPTRVGPLVKRMFIAPPGYKIAGGDYSQMELRIIAWLSQDSVLLDAFMKGIDSHALTASNVYGIPIDEVTFYQRYVGKTCNFLLCYGGSYLALVRSVGYKLMGPEAKPTDYSDAEIEQRAKILRSKYFKGYRRILSWGEEVIRQARADGYVTSMYGRVQYLPNILDSDDRRRGHAGRQAVNMNPQSTAADYVLFRFTDCQAEFDRLGVDVYPLINIHDFMGFEIPDGFDNEFCKILQDVGTRPDESEIGVPMVIEPKVGSNLGEVA